MAQTVDISNYDFYLNFIDLPFGMKQIDEPIGIDVINLVTKTDGKGYANNVYFGGDDSVDLTFTSEVGSKGLGYCFFELSECDLNKGFESQIEFLIYNRVTLEYFLIGKLEFQKRKTDEYSFYKFTITQSTNQALIKRRFDIKVDLFSNEDLDNNPLAPVQTSNILLKAKPVRQISDWDCPSEQEDEKIIQDTNVKFNFINNSLSYQIKNSLSYIGEINFGGGSNNGSRFIYIDAQDNLSDVTVDLSDIDINVRSAFGNNSSGFARGFDGDLRIRYLVGSDYETAEVTEIDLGSGVDFGSYSRAYENINYQITLSIPSGSKFWLFFIQDVIFGGIDTFQEYKATIKKGNIKITATATGIDTVTKGVRLIDAVKRVSKGVNQDFELDAPRLESQGEHYDQFVFSGDMIRGREAPFNITWKEVTEYVMSEINSDIDITDNNLFIGQEDDFRPNIEIGVFEHYPDESYSLEYNERFLTNQYTTSFKSYNQDKDDENTIDAVHTEMQLLNKNLNVENEKVIECDFIRDPFLISTTQIKAATETTTSLTQDDKKFLIDCIEIAPNTNGGFTRILDHNYSATNNELKLFINNANWTILGFQVGDIFTIETTSNAGDYNVVEITNNIITLTPINVVPTTIGEEITEVSFPLTDVDYVNRTNEGFSLIEGVNVPDNYSNLRYTLKRSLINYWGSYLATTTLRNLQPIDVTYLKNNVDLRTQLDGENIVSELDPIQQSELPAPLTTDRIIFINVRCSFAQYIDLKDKIKLITNTDTYIKKIGGFIRVINNNGKVLKGYPKLMDFTWSNNLLRLEMEEKYENPITNIGFANSMFFINEVGYPFESVTKLDYEVTDTDYIQFFDAVTRPLTNKLRYSLVSVNGQTFNNMTDLTIAIAGL